MSDEVKPCPFCGARGVPLIDPPEFGCWDACSQANDLETWNTRPLEDALRSERDALAGELERLRVASGIAPAKGGVIEALTGEIIQLRAQLAQVPGKLAAAWKLGREAASWLEYGEVGADRMRRDLESLAGEDVG
jgi:hypothetical protein